MLKKMGLFPAYREAIFVQNGEEPSLSEPGRLGWELFYNVNLLVDISNSKISFCDSLETLQEYGYKIENFSKAPLLLDRGLIEFESQTSQGLLRCVLDTGSTFNFLHIELEKAQKIEQILWEDDNIVNYSSFEIDKKNFGPIYFHKMPIKIPIHIDAILGMDFFREHIVFIDFKRRAIYFSNCSDIN